MLMYILMYNYTKLYLKLYLKCNPVARLIKNIYVVVYGPMGQMACTCTCTT